MIGDVYDYNDIKSIARLGERAQLASVEKWAKGIGLRYSYDGKGGIWTTKDALNRALGLDAGTDGPVPYSADMVA